MRFSIAGDVRGLTDDLPMQSATRPTPPNPCVGRAETLQGVMHVRQPFAIGPAAV